MTKPANNLPHKYVKCRLLGHAWDYTTVQRDGRNLIQGLRCLRCGTERKVTINGRTGVNLRNNYNYAPNYTVPGGMSARDRAELRLEEFRQHLLDEFRENASQE